MSEAEKMLKKTKKKGEIERLDDSIIHSIFDDVQKEMDDFRIDENYKVGISRLDIEKVIFYQNPV